MGASLLLNILLSGRKWVRGTVRQFYGQKTLLAIKFLVLGGGGVVGVLEGGGVGFWGGGGECRFYFVWARGFF